MTLMRKHAKTRPPAARLLYADSARNADQLYFSGIHVPDPFIAMEVRGEKIGVFNALEFGRALKESTLDRVESLEAWSERAARLSAPSGPAGVILALARSLRVKRFQVARDFPVGLADALRAAGLGIEPAPGALFPQREIKSEAEARAIAEGNRCSARGFRVVEDMLRRATVRGRRLFLDGRVLTSERVREAIQIACLQAGAEASHTIVAGGDQACDPHCVGSGPLHAGELIIVDIFPRVMKTGYHGDMTRTFLKGTPSDAQVALVEAVRGVQKEAIGLIRPNVDGREVHRLVCAAFEKRGYRTERGADGARGFIHGTGHGLGLDVHEGPSIGRFGTRLRAGAVVTVEPGLYYPGLGGCRIEDVVQVREGGPRMLSRHPYRWVIE